MADEVKNGFGFLVICIVCIFGLSKCSHAKKEKKQFTSLVYETEDTFKNKNNQFLEIEDDSRNIVFTDSFLDTVSELKTYHDEHHFKKGKKLKGKYFNKICPFCMDDTESIFNTYLYRDILASVLYEQLVELTHENDLKQMIDVDLKDLIDSGAIFSTTKEDEKYALESFRGVYKSYYLVNTTDYEDLIEKIWEYHKNYHLGIGSDNDFDLWNNVWMCNKEENSDFESLMNDGLITECPFCIAKAENLENADFRDTYLYKNYILPAYKKFIEENEFESAMNYIRQEMEDVAASAMKL